MAYTALEKMRQINRERFGADVGPFQPPRRNLGKMDLKSAALRFLHERCEGLLFDAGIEKEEKKTGVYQGKSLAAGQIPYNMERDLDRLSLEKTLADFIDSGTAEDAYLVYYCYLEMFLGRYGKSKKMVELLSEYESNGSSLLMKHRDHYSHSVYVFALGLAIYETNAGFRRTFRTFYGMDPDGRNHRDSRRAANLFLEYWGLTALFHDIGYPFELPFEQVLSYFEVDNLKRGKGSLYLAYRSVAGITAMSGKESARFQTLYGRDFSSSTELFAYDIAQKLGRAYGFTEEYMYKTLRGKPTHPERFGYYMDHAFFSSVRLFRELRRTLGPENLTAIHVDALTAIMLHNSVFKFSIAFYKSKDPRPPLRAELHPLAWLLMLCDELQCWDRTAYGRSSRTELHPMAVDFDFSGEAIFARYYYDQEEAEKIAAFQERYAEWEKGGEQGDAPRLKDYSDMAEKEQRFTNDIKKIVDTSHIPLTVEPGIRAVNRKSKHTFLSSSNFLHLYDFAVALHGRNMPPEVTPEELEKKFQALSLEYQLSTINRAKHFSRYLDAVGCFFTDKPVDYEMVTVFGPREAGVFAPMEHERWVREHQAMGWRRGDAYETAPLPADLADGEEKAFRSALREQMRVHKLAMDGKLTRRAVREHYLSLSEEDQDKDWKPFNSMLRLLKKFDGLRIYRL